MFTNLKKALATSTSFNRFDKLKNSLIYNGDDDMPDLTKLSELIDQMGRKGLCMKSALSLRSSFYKEKGGLNKLCKTMIVTLVCLKECSIELCQHFEDLPHFVELTGTLAHEDRLYFTSMI